MQPARVHIARQRGVGRGQSCQPRSSTVTAMPAEPLDQSPAEELQAIAAELRRLSPSWQRPEIFHETKSELGARLMRLSRRLDMRPAIPLRIAPIVPVRPRYTPPPPPSPQLPTPPPPTPSCAALAPRRRVSRRHRYPRPGADPRQEALL